MVVKFVLLNFKSSLVALIFSNFLLSCLKEYKTSNKEMSCTNVSCINHNKQLHNESVFHDNRRLLKNQSVAKLNLPKKNVDNGKHYSICESKNIFSNIKQNKNYWKSDITQKTMIHQNLNTFKKNTRKNLIKKYKVPNYIYKTKNSGIGGMVTLPSLALFAIFMCVFTVTGHTVILSSMGIMLPIILTIFLFMSIGIIA